MICRRRKYLAGAMNFGNTFEDSWEKIFVNTESDLSKNQNCLKDHYFKEVPLSQTLLTDSDNVSSERIQFPNFNQIPFEQINQRNLYDCFHGILNYIYYYSGNKFNIEEIEIHYSGSKSRESLEKIDKYYKTNTSNRFDIKNIFDYENINTEFQIGLIRNAYFGVTFKRIKINPISYSIRSGIFTNNGSHLVSFTFEGYNEESNQWDILDERENINDLISEGSYQMFTVRQTNKNYSSFKIKQTNPSSNGFWGFSISGFEIHGTISYRENRYTTNNINLDCINQITKNYSFSYDPEIDMTEYF